jgi:hypothetical protein
LDVVPGVVVVDGEAVVVELSVVDFLAVVVVLGAAEDFLVVALVLVDFELFVVVFFDAVADFAASGDRVEDEVYGDFAHGSVATASGFSVEPIRSSDALVLGPTTGPPEVGVTVGEPDPGIVDGVPADGAGGVVTGVFGFSGVDEQPARTNAQTATRHIAIRMGAPSPR